MKYLIKLFYVIILLLYFTGCEKSTESNSPYSGYHYITEGEFDGITYTDVNGNQFSTTDPTDWNIMDWFSPAISSLFSFPDTLNYSGADTSTISLYPAYPNPTNQLLALIVNSTQTTVMKLVIVDSLQTIKFRSANALIPGSNALYFDFQDSTLPLNSKYRMYYRFYHTSTTFYKSGHGDILKQ